MDYFNDINNTGFYTTTTSGEFYAYPIETSVPGWVEVRIYETSPYGWGVGGWPDYPASSQVSPRAETGPFISHGPTHIFLESTSSVTSSGAQTQDYKHSSFPEGHQSAAGWDTQSSPSGVVGRGNYTVGSGTSAVVPVSDDHPIGCGGADQSESSGPCTSAQNSYQPSIGPTGTEATQTWRSEPYWAHCTGSDESAIAEAGLSNSALQPTPYTALPPTHSPGELSEASAGAEHQNTVKEEAVPISPSPSTGKPLTPQARYDELVRQFRALMQTREHLTYPPTHERALGIALGVVRTINTPVYPAPRLSGTHHSRTATGERGPDLKYQRRKRIRRLNEELSRYYVLPEGQVEWACCGLLSKVLRDVERVPKTPDASPG